MTSEDQKQQPVPCGPSDQHTSSAAATGRRTAVLGTAAAGLALVGTAGCAAGSRKDRSELPTKQVELGSPDEVPVGGAKLYREQRLVVSQPSKGTFKAFSAVCTHKGCVLTEVHGEEGDCPCHGSRFDVATGKVLQGPAPKPLPPVPVRAEGGKLVAGPGKG